jgi:hypothetical protein
MKILKSKWLWGSLLLVPIVFFAGFIIWAETPSSPMPEALAAMSSSSAVVVSSDSRGLVFAPTAQEPIVGFAFYPGGRVDYRAYAPLAGAIAEQGYLVVVMPVRLNLAFFDIDRPQPAIANSPGIGAWAVGGHSLGGVAATQFIKNHPGEVQGLILLASYPADTIVDSGVKAVSILGTNDQLAGGEKYATARPLLPRDTTFVSIEGGNHAQYGWYGLQDGDGVATIDRLEQQRQTVAAIVEPLKSISPK